MSKIIKTILVVGLTLLLSSNTYAFSNKDTFLTDLSNLESRLNNIKTNSIGDLTNRVLNISNDYDKFISSKDKSSGLVEYFISLGLLNTDLKEDLSSDFNTLSRDINQNIGQKVDELKDMENIVKINYSTLSETKKTSMSNDYQKIYNASNDLQDSFNRQIKALNDEYNTKLTNFKNSFDAIYNNNLSKILELSEFDKVFNKLTTVFSEFDKNYREFETIYLSYSGDLKKQSDSLQSQYSSYLRDYLLKLKDKNLDNNKPLQSFEDEYDRQISTLVKNFENALKIYVDENYSMIFGYSDIDTINSQYNAFKTRFYESSGLLKSNEVLGDRDAISRIGALYDSIYNLNNSTSTLLGGDYANNPSYNTLKTNLQNSIISFYNNSYKDYGDELLGKLKDRIDYLTLEQQSVVVISDTIDLRLDLLLNQIKNSNNLDDDRSKIDEFKVYISKYEAVNNEKLLSKIKKIKTNLEVSYLKKDLSNFKYRKYSFKETDKSKVDLLLGKIKDKYKDTYDSKFDRYIYNIDVIYATGGIKNLKVDYIIKNIKLRILENY